MGIFVGGLWKLKKKDGKDWRHIWTQSQALVRKQLHQCTWIVSKKTLRAVQPPKAPELQNAFRNKWDTNASSNDCANKGHCSASVLS